MKKQHQSLKGQRVYESDTPEKRRTAKKTADDYIDPELVNPGQEYNQIKVAQAKRILDEHVSYLSKDCYMRLNHDIVKKKNPETIRVMLAFKNHHSVDLLVRNCQLLYNETEYNMMVATESPTKSTRKRSVKRTLSSSEEREPYRASALRTTQPRRPKSSILYNKTAKVIRK